MLNIFALAVICALAIGQSANGQFPDSYWVIAAVSLLASLPIVVAFGITLSHKQADGRHKVISTSRWFDFHMLSWCLSALSIIFVAKWPDWVHGRVFVEDWFLVDQIVILAPLWISWFASWTILFGLFRSEQTDTLGTHQTVRFESIRFAIKQSRLTLFLAWAPVLNFSTLHDLIRPWADVIGESTVPIIVLVVNGLLLMTIFPRMLAMLWDAQPMPAGPLRSRLEEAAARAGLRLQDILIWRTQHRICNAVVAGVWPGTRRIFISDGLLTRFSDEEIEAIFIHELGHLVHRHLLCRFALLLAPVSLMLVLFRFGHHLGLQASDDGGSLLVIGTLLYLVVALGWYSRQLEHQADLWACRRLAQGSSRAVALQRYLSVLWRIESQHSHRGSWMHPSYRRRRDFLVASLTARRHADAFEREMRWLAGMLAAFALLPLLAIL